MAARIPRAYRKSISAKRFNKNVLKRIYLDTEKEFIAGAFLEEADGTFRLRDDLTPEEITRLARVSKDIRKNRGLLKIGRIAIPLIIVSGAVMFNLLFLDRILETNGERLLERAFGARVEIEGLDAKPLTGEITLAGLVVADRDRPMRNLFQFGRTTIAIRTPELLTRRVVIREISTTGLSFGTERTSSGALDERGETSTPEADTADVGPNATERAEAGIAAVAESLGIDGLGGISFDVDSLIAEAREDLTVTTLVPEAIADAQAVAESTRAQIDGIATRVEGLSETVDEARAIQPASLTNPQTILATIETIETTRASVNTLGEDTRALQRSIQQEIAQLRATEAALRNAAQNDLAALRARIPDFDIDPRSIAEDSARAFAAGFLGETWNTVQRVLGIAQRVQDAFPESEEDGRRTQRRGGVDVPFATTPYPRLLIERLAGDGSHDGQTVAMTITDISSDPDLTDTVTAFTFIRETGDGERLDLMSRLDLRSDTDERMTNELTMSGVSVALPAAARNLGFTDLTGPTHLAGAAILSRDGVLNGTLDAAVDNPELTAGEDASMAATLIARVASEQEEIDARFAFEVKDAAITSLDASSSLTAVLRDQIEQLIADVRAEAEARIEEELDRIVAEQIARLAEEVEILDALVGLSTEELLAIETYQRILDEKETELEARIADVRGQAEAAIRAEAEEAEAQARAEVEAAAEAAAREAESRIQDATGGVRLPSFRN